MKPRDSEADALGKNGSFKSFVLDAEFPAWLSVYHVCLFVLFVCYLLFVFHVSLSNRSCVRHLHHAPCHAVPCLAVGSC